MKIIKRGKLREKLSEPKKIECCKCKSTLEYEESDILHHQLIGDYIICPVCKEYINID